MGIYAYSPITIFDEIVFTDGTSRTWIDYLDRGWFKDTKTTIAGFTRYSDVNRHYIVSPYGVIEKRYGFHGYALFNSMIEHARERNEIGIGL